MQIKRHRHQKEKSKPTRSQTYNEKTAVNGSFIQIVKAAVKNANDKSVKKDAKK